MCPNSYVAFGLGNQKKNPKKNQASFQIWRVA
jgi:hypothetical protein